MRQQNFDGFMCYYSCFWTEFFSDAVCFAATTLEQWFVSQHTMRCLTEITTKQLNSKHIFTRYYGHGHALSHTFTRKTMILNGRQRTMRRRAKNVVWYKRLYVFMTVDGHDGNRNNSSILLVRIQCDRMALRKRYIAMLIHQKYHHVIVSIFWRGPFERLQTHKRHTHTHTGAQIIEGNNHRIE